MIILLKYCLLESETAMLRENDKTAQQNDNKPVCDYMNHVTQIPQLGCAVKLALGNNGTTVNITRA
jgi:hypothetical protein